jgi:hypothetical protein
MGEGGFINLPVGISGDSSSTSVLSHMCGSTPRSAPLASTMTDSRGSSGTDDSTTMVVTGTALNAMTSDSFSGSEARVSVALPGFSKPREEEGLHTTNLQFTSKALGYLQCGLLYY